MSYKDRDWLYEKYVVERNSTREIADICDVTAPTIQYWLDKLEIPIRHGSEAIKTQWEGNKERKEQQAEWMKEIRNPWWEMDDKTQEEVRERLSEWWSENNPMEGKNGEKNPAWKGGKELWYGSNWEEQSEKRREKDGYECQMCGKAQSEHYRDLSVHHKKRLAWFKENYDRPEWWEKGNDLDNLITLCDRCHAEAEHSAD